MRGVTLIAIGGYGYLKWAVNMAVSLKYHSPDVAIQLITSEKLFLDASGKKELFDIITVVENQMFEDESGRLFPAKLKTQLYQLLHFDETIYLDVDGCIIKDITPLFEIKENLATDVQGVYDISQGAVFNHLKWAKPKEIWEHFNLPKEAKLPAINSSFLFLRKCKEVEVLFQLSHWLLMETPLPYSKHWYIWGHHREHKVSQPDELYLNVAMAKLNIIPKNEVAIYFRMMNDPGERESLYSVRTKFYGIGLFGQLETNHRSSREMYDSAMRQMWYEKTGTTTFETSENLSKTKFAVI